MMGKQKTPIALAIDILRNKNKSIIVLNDYKRGRQDSFLEVINILKSLKPKEREMFEASVNHTVKYLTASKVNELGGIYFETNLTQE